jgi:hypothetical protein
LLVLKALDCPFLLLALKITSLRCEDCPNLDFGNWQKALEGTIENPTIIDDDSGDTIEVDDNNQGLLYTAQEVEEGIMIKEEDESEVTSDSGVDLGPVQVRVWRSHGVAVRNWGPVS